MYKEIEVYVVDMIAKFPQEESHVVDLRKLFERLKKYQLKLNLVKCTFEARSGKLLGFIVSKRRIKVDQSYIGVFIPMHAQKNEKFLGETELHH